MNQDLINAIRDLHRNALVAWDRDIGDQLVNYQPDKPLSGHVLTDTVNSLATLDGREPGRTRFIGFVLEQPGYFKAVMYFDESNPLRVSWELEYGGSL